MHTAAAYQLFCDVSQWTNHPLFVFSEIGLEFGTLVHFVKEVCAKSSTNEIDQTDHMLIAASISFHFFCPRTQQTITNAVHGYRQIFLYLYGTSPSITKLRQAIKAAGSSAPNEFASSLYQQHISHLESDQIENFMKISHYALLMTLVIAYLTNALGEDAVSLYVAEMYALQKLRLSVANYKYTLMRFDACSHSAKHFADALDSLPEAKVRYTEERDLLCQLGVFTECYARYKNAKHEFSFVDVFSPIYESEPDYDPLIHPFALAPDVPFFLIVPIILVDERDLATYASVLAESVDADTLKEGIDLGGGVWLTGCDISNK